MIACELQGLEDLMTRAGLLLTGEAYDKAQEALGLPVEVFLGLIKEGAVIK